MKVEEVKYVGFGVKLRVIEDGFSARGFGPVVPIKKREILVAHSVNRDSEDPSFSVLQNDKDEITVFYDQVELVDTPYNINNTKPIRYSSDLYKGINLICIKEQNEFGLGQQVKLYSDNRIEIDYDGKYFAKDHWASLNHFALPKEEKTKKELLELLNSHLNEHTIEDEETHRKIVELVENI